jgi:pyrimidine-specific ribonucleoside hydrolase
MNLILETDLGRDADDFFAICYLLSACVNIRAITISPGDKDQISVAKFMCNRLGVNIPIGSAKPDREKSSVGGVHVHVLKKANWPERMDPDGYGPDIIKDTLAAYPDCELFSIGPLQSVGPYLINNPSASIERATMQGGFAGYHLHAPTVRMEKFEGKETVPTFNLGGDKKSAQYYVQTSQVKNKQFVGKNLCHTIVYDPPKLEEHLKFYRNHFAPEPMRLFLDTMQLFFDNGAPYKMFHDPTAAVCHLHPDIGTWYDGELYYEKGQWGTRAGSGHRVLVDIDREQLWKHIIAGT